MSGITWLKISDFNSKITDIYTAFFKHFPTTFSNIIWNVKYGDYVNKGDVIFSAENKMLPFGIITFSTNIDGYVVFDTQYERAMTIKGNEKLIGISETKINGTPNKRIISGTNGYYDGYCLISPLHNGYTYIQMPVISTAVSFFAHPHIKWNQKLFKIIQWLNNDDRRFYCAGMAYAEHDNLPKIFVNEDYTIDIESQYSSIQVRNEGMLPNFIHFNNVNGDFRLDFYPITEGVTTTLKGCPVKITGNFDCERNELTTFEGCPQYIGGDFTIKRNKLTSFIGMPNYIGGCFNFANNELTDEAWEYCRDNIDGEFCDYNHNGNKFIKYRKGLE